MKQKLSALWDAFKVAFDSLVRTYTPQILATIIGALTAANVHVTDELKAFLGLGVAFVFFVVWYLLNRLYEVVTGKVSKLLTFGLVQTKPVVYSPLTKRQLIADHEANRARRELSHARLGE